ncbi:MAG: Mini-ribonuclease 3 [Christensenellales bacterium]|jgi:ribonuclease-3 family protein
MNKQKAFDAYDVSLGEMDENRLRQLSPLALAYIGDTVYDLYIRAYLVKNNMGRVTDLHALASGVVNARSQAKAAKLLLPYLNDRESEIFRLGKNAKSTPPKNMSHQDYSYATAIEAVVGYLYLMGLRQRTDALFRIIIHHFFEGD